MSVRIMTAVWEHSQHRGEALLTLLALADYADNEGLAWPSAENLARKARLYPRSVWRVLRTLCESGELVVERGGGRGRSNRYRIALKPCQNNSDSETVIANHCSSKPETLSLETQNPVTETGDPSETRHDPPLGRASVVKLGKSSRRKPETPFPADFALTAELRDYATAQGRNPDHEFEQFRQYAIAHDRRYRDWSGAFRKWCASEYGRNASRNGAAPSRSMSANDYWAGK